MLLLSFAMLAVFFAVFPVWWFARRRPGYSHIRDTISELGETGAPDAKKVAMFAFAPAGHAMWLFVAALAFAAPELAGRPGLWLFALLGASYVGAAMFPCDPGAPMWGTWRNNIHNLLAGAGYLGALAGMIELGKAMEDIPARHCVDFAGRRPGGIVRRVPAVVPVAGSWIDPACCRSRVLRLDAAGFRRLAGELK